MIFDDDQGLVCFSLFHLPLFLLLLPSRKVLFFLFNFPKISVVRNQKHFIGSNEKQIDQQKSNGIFFTNRIVGESVFKYLHLK